MSELIKMCFLCERADNGVWSFFAISERDEFDEVRKAKSFHVLNGYCFQYRMIYPDVQVDRETAKKHSTALHTGMTTYIDFRS